MRSGIKLVTETIGEGRPAARGQSVTVRWEIALNRGAKVREGVSTFTLGRREVFAGMEYAVEGMRAGGTRTVRVSPHLGYRDAGVPGSIPPNAALVVTLALERVEDRPDD